MRDQIVEKLAAAIARHTARSIPLAVDLWSVTEIADYLKCTERYVLDNYAARPDFPHGELLSVGTNGAHNYACHPVKVLAWMHARMSKTPNAAGKAPSAPADGRH